MTSRMSKYEDSPEEILSRSQRNEKLYQELNKQELGNFEVESNAVVLHGDYDEEIDISKLKEILDDKYKDAPRKSIRLEVTEEIQSIKEETKEYDINTILSKAREEQPLSYEEVRKKRVRDTQYDILNSLQIEEEAEEKTDLMELINTINLNEQKTSEGDLFDDLKETFAIDKEVLTEANETFTKEETLEQTFFSKSTQFNPSDFEEEDSNTKKDRSIFNEIIIVLILLAFLGGLFIFIKSLMNF